MLFTLALVGCDHATKAVAAATLGRRGAVSVIPGVLDLQYAENRDTAFSLLRGHSFPGKGTLLVVMATLALLAMAWAWWRRRRAALPEQAAYALIVAGALGNVIDRMRRGYVVDFIKIPRWPVFNVADIAIVAGGLLLAIILFRRRRALLPPA